MLYLRITPASIDHKGLHQVTVSVAKKERRNEGENNNITLTTRLVDTVTTPMLLRIVQFGRLDAKKLVSHRFKLSEIMKAYDIFGNAAKERALKVVLKNARARGRASKENLN